MTGPFDNLTARELRSISSAVASGRITLRPSEFELRGHCGAVQASRLAAELASLTVDAPALAMFLSSLATERDRLEAQQRAIALVWTGPAIPNDTYRETGAVVRELFSAAKQSILLVGYAVHRGRDVFRLLADRMDVEPGLAVRLILDVRRFFGDTSLGGEIVPRFARDFRDVQWPGKRLPDVFYDPRSLHEDVAQRSAMHAKCIVVDDTAAFVTSANFTTAAQTKNLEVGFLARDPVIASGLATRFKFLIDSGWFRQLEFI